MTMIVRRRISGALNVTHRLLLLVMALAAVTALLSGQRWAWAVVTSTGLLSLAARLGADLVVSRVRRRS